jgi:hypothetical protein
MGRSKQSGMSRQLDYRRMAQSEKQRQAAINTPTWLKVVAHCVPVPRRSQRDAVDFAPHAIDASARAHAVEAPGRRSITRRRPASPSSS